MADPNRAAAVRIVEQALRPEGFGTAGNVTASPSAANYDDLVNQAQRLLESGLPQPSVLAAIKKQIAPAVASTRPTPDTGAPPELDAGDGQPTTPEADFAAYLESAGYLPIPGRPGIYFNPLTGDSVNLNTTAGGGSGAAAPTARHSTVMVGNDLYSFNDLTGQLTPLNVSVPPGVVSTSVDRNGNLIGIKEDGTSVVIQEGFDYPATDPERQFALDEAEVTGVYNGSPTIRAQEEAGRNSRANLDARVSGFQSVNTLAPQLGRLALDNSAFVADVLRRPSDAIARLALSRGGDPTTQIVSQSDVINMLRNNIAGFQSAISGFDASTPGAGAAASPSMPQSAPSTTTTFDQAGFDAAREAAITSALSTDPNVQKVQAAIAALGTGPLAGLRAPGLQAQLTAAEAAARESALAKFGADSGALISQFTIPQETTQQATAGFNFTAPTLPTPAPISEDQIRSARDTVRANSPALSAIFSGSAVPGFSFGRTFAGGLPTLANYSRLSTGEREALASDLAVDQIDIGDVEQAISNRFSAPQSRARARSVGFAA